MDRLADYHTHTALCGYAEGWPIDYARAAVEKGLEELGISDHNPMPLILEPYDYWRMRLDDLPRYVESVETARAAYPFLPIRLGLEVDYIAGQESWIEELAKMADWDYLIGSVHYIAPGWDVEHPRHLWHYRERLVDQIWQLYFTAYENCIRSGFFDFVAHPDLPKKFGYRPHGDLRRFYEPVVAALAETRVAFEINTSGLRRPVGECYPAQEFLRLAHAAGVSLVINSDAHTPSNVGAGFEIAAKLARNAGFSETLRFFKRERRNVALGSTRKYQKRKPKLMSPQKLNPRVVRD